VTAAIDWQSDASNERSTIRGEEGDRFGHFLRKSRPTQRVSFLAAAQKL